MVCVCFNTGICESQQVSGEIIQGFPKNFKKKKSKNFENQFSKETTEMVIQILKPSYQDTSDTGMPGCTNITEMHICDTESTLV